MDAAMRFLFWNLNKKPLLELVSQLVVEHAIDFVILAECVGDDDEWLQLFERATGVGFKIPWHSTKKLKFFHRNEIHLSCLGEGALGNWVAWRFGHGNHELTLIAAHLPAKMGGFTDFAALNEEGYFFASEIREIELKEQHSRTILVGDLNMNPFDSAMVSVRGLNAVMTKSITDRKFRTFKTQKFPFFYNPMWGLWGDRTHGPPASYYLNRSGPQELFWHMIDQVLLRPDIMHLLNQVQILGVCQGKLLGNEQGHPGGDVMSDHYPLFFSLNQK